MLSSLVGSRLRRCWREGASLLVAIALLASTAAPAIAEAPNVRLTESALTPDSAAAEIDAVPDTQWSAIVAAGVWHKGCPAGQSQLRKVSVNFHGFDNAVHRGSVVVRADVAGSVARIFTQLFDAGFPIHRMTPIETYSGDDNASMAADNTSAFNCRTATQANAPSSSSPHANGRAIDINPYENPWLDPRCDCFRPDAKFASARSGPGVVTKSSVAWRIFTSEGWTWQDSAHPDYQHFDTGYPSRPLPAAKQHFPVAATVGNATQIITVKASGSRATLTAWTKGAHGWHAVLTTASARIGAKGLADGATRRQNTNTTPSGTYALTQAFGISANPGTALPYHVVTKSDWWVEDNNSPYYNTMRSSSKGGFDTAAPESSTNGSEHLITHLGQYNYAIVIDYNMNPSVPYRGAGIFLHVSNGRPTAGCVAVPVKTLVALLHWLKPSARPRIAIG